MSALLDHLVSLVDSTSVEETSSSSTAAPKVSDELKRANALRLQELRVVPTPVHRSLSAAADLDVSVLRSRGASTTAGVSAETRVVASQLLAEWHGQVQHVGEDSFTAELKGRHGAGIVGAEEEGVIPLGDVRPADLELLQPGAFFRLSISYELDVTGSKRRFAQVIFRRMPAYRREELEAARERARELVRGLRVE